MIFISISSSQDLHKGHHIALWSQVLTQAHQGSVRHEDNKAHRLKSWMFENHDFFRIKAVRTCTKVHFDSRSLQILMKPIEVPQSSVKEHPFHTRFHFSNSNIYFYTSVESFARLSVGSLIKPVALKAVHECSSCQLPLPSHICFN